MSRRLRRRGDLPCSRSSPSRLAALRPVVRVHRSVVRRQPRLVRGSASLTSSRPSQSSSCRLALDLSVEGPCAGARPAVDDFVCDASLLGWFCVSTRDASRRVRRLLSSRADSSVLGRRMHRDYLVALRVRGDPATDPCTWGSCKGPIEDPEKDS